MTATMKANTVRGRPKSRAKRDQILAVAAELFPRHGFDGVSMDVVAEQAGVSKQTVYNHFRNKEELFGETISRKCAEYGIVPEAIDMDRPCEQMLLDIANHFSDLILSDDALHMWRLTIGSAEQHPAVARLFYHAGPANAVQVVADYFAEQSRRGRLSIDDPELAARQLLYMLKGDAWMRIVLNVEPRPSQAEIRRYNETCVDFFLRGCR